MPFALKDLRWYSGALAAAFFTSAAIHQPPQVYWIPLIISFMQGSIIGSVIFFVGLAILFWLAICWPVFALNRFYSKGTWTTDAGWTFLRNGMVNKIPAVLCIAYGLSFPLKGVTMSPFVVAGDYWRLGFLAYGLFLFGPEETAEASTEVPVLGSSPKEEISVTAPPPSHPFGE